MAATLGKSVRIKVSGVAVPFVALPMTNSGDSKTYTITDATKRVLDPTVAVLVYYNAVLQSSALYTINRLSGQVTFLVAQGASAVTVTGSYLPMTTVAEATSFSLACKATLVDDTAFGDTDVTRQQAQKTCSGAIGKWWKDNAFSDALDAGLPIVIERSIANGATPAWRAWALLTERSHDAAMAGLQEEPLSWEGSPDADNRSLAFLL
jgi:hypothetical protein